MGKRRRHRGAFVSVLVAALAAAGPAAAAGLPKQSPNILFVLSDDQPYGTIERMPFLSRHRGRFTSFTRLFNNTPTCCPARATLLSGLYSHHHGVENNGLGAVFDPTETLATWLDDAGYETALFGKYLNGYPFGHDRLEVPPGWDRWAGFSGDVGYYNYRLNLDGSRRSYGSRPRDYSTDVLRRHAVSFLRSAPQPFFAFVAPFGPHLPAISAPGDDGAFTGKPMALEPNFNRRAVGAPQWWLDRPQLNPQKVSAVAHRQWAALLSVDHLLARAMKALRRRGVRERTVIVYHSDNGLSLGSHRWLRKDCAYDECGHVPLLISAPGGVRERVVGEVASNVDIAPTLAELAGASPAPMDGHSLVPLLQGSPGWSRRPVLMHHLRAAGAPPSSPPTFWGVRARHWKYVEHADGAVELYDLRSDPFELENLGADPAYAGRRRALAEELARLRSCAPGAC